MKKFASFVLTSGLAVFLLGTPPLRAVPGDEHWDPQFNWPGTTNVVYAIAVHNGKIYSGGFVTAGSTTNASLNVWDGLQWSPLAFITGNSSPEIRDMAFVGDTLYVGGAFNTINGALLGTLAKWDGMNWSGVGLAGTVDSLAVSGGNLYAAGAFTNLDGQGVVMTNIGYFDGSSWHAMGTGLGKPGGTVESIAIQGGLIYAGGFFTNAGSQFVTNMAVWNGSSWSQVGGGVGVPLSSIVYTVGVNGSDVYAGGVFTQAGTTPATNIARWDGANWNSVGGGLTGTGAGVTSLAALNGSVCMTGVFTNAGGLKVTNFVIWNGSFWDGAKGGISSTGYRVINNGTNVYVGGLFLAAGNKLANSIASWDGVNWSPIGTPGQINGLSGGIRAMANDGTNLYAGGAFLWAGLTNAVNIARWDGTNWWPVGAGLNNTVDAIAVTNNLIYAGGLFTAALDGTALPYFGVWNGTNWTSLGSAGGLVYATAVNSNGVYAAGTYYAGTQYGSPYFNRWDGTNWNNVIVFTNNTFFAVPLSDPVGYDAIALQDTNVYLGGYIAGFSQFDPNELPINATNCGNIIWFHGGYGWIMGTGLNSNVTSMAVRGTNLYVSGLFTNAGGVTAGKIAMWNGNYWTNVGSGVVGSGNVNSLTTMGGNLYAGGSFTNMGGTPANHIAKWDGTNWYALGNGTTYPGLNSGTVGALASSGSDLYIGGTFRAAGDKASFNIARWNGQKNFDIPQIRPLLVTNGQFRMRLSGIGGLTNIIQATTNFSTWTPVLTNSAGIYDFTDPDSAAYSHRFYRAVLGP
ncbi:MAG TPA: hypothetical protein VN836_11060 [Verrucomicrobiae bacterium]|nr:hypothetical protein [Verrucomicrobiae bacterium]